MQKFPETLLKQRIAVRCQALGACGTSIGGSLVRTLRRCGRSNCRCAQDADARHVSHVLPRKVKRKTKALYVPVDMVKEVEHWVRERRRVRRLLAEMDALTEQLIRNHVRANRAVRQNRARIEATRATSSRPA